MAISEDPKFRNKRTAFVKAMHGFETHEPSGERPSLNEWQMDLLKVLKRRNYPLAFKDDATNEDIVHVMSGKLAQTVFLRREKQHSYPSLVFSPREISVLQEIKSAVSASVSLSSQDDTDQVKTRKKNVASDKITKWIKDPGATTQHDNPLKQTSFETKPKTQQLKLSTAKNGNGVYLNNWKLLEGVKVEAYQGEGTSENSPSWSFSLADLVKAERRIARGSLRQYNNT